MTSQFALRVAILGGVALAMFSIIFLRLWYLQVLSGDKYADAAQNNRIREIEIPAPRGEILDRDGEVLVDNRTSLALQVRADELPNAHAERTAVIEGLAELAGRGPDWIEKQIREQTAELPASPVTLMDDVDYRLVYYLKEHQEDFPGVTIERVFVRGYPQGTLGAHLFGFVREVSQEQLETPRYERLEPGDTVGITGLEETYDHLLRGVDGATRVQVDALGRPKGDPLSAREPEPGNDLVLTVDGEVQTAGEAALSQYGGGLPGAFVAMDANTGAILGLGSTPTFDPDVYTGHLSQAEYNSLTSEANESPQTNRAIQGLYPTGSTFKLITATAALQEGLIGPTETFYDSGSFDLGDGFVRENSGGAAYGTIAMSDALKVSSDVFFYEMGRRAENAGDEAIQDWAFRLGLGGPTGIDLPSEFGGLIPTPEWRNALFRDELTDRPWSVGDNVNLAIGQGDLQVTPLQLAVAYATVANGGDVVRPHIAQRVLDPVGRTVEEIESEPRRQIEIAPSTRRTILEGLHRAAMEEGGTSYGVFGGWPIEVAGKTGTAERAPNPDQSWYVGMAPYDNPQIVVVATIERGGFGADAAAPAVSEILQSYFPNVSDKIRSASSSTDTYE